MIAGLVITLKPLPSALSRLHDSVCQRADIELGQCDENAHINPAGVRIPATLETTDRRAAEAITQWLQNLPFVFSVDVVFVHLGVPREPGQCRAADDNAFSNSF